MELDKLEGALEAILFASGTSVPITELASAICQDEKTTKLILKSLSDKLHAQERGIQIIELNNSYQMCTNPCYYDYISILYQNPSKKQLTQPLIETLAIIAYKQPITKVQIEEIRGVDASHAVNKLAEYGLVCEKGRLDTPGQPVLFGTTDDFLRYIGLNSLGSLPEIQGFNIEPSGTTFVS